MLYALAFIIMEMIHMFATKGEYMPDNTSMLIAFGICAICSRLTDIKDKM